MNNLDIAIQTPISQALLAVKVMEQGADKLHDAMMEVLGEISDKEKWSKRDIQSSETLAMLFNADYKGVDRGSFFAWVAKYTPIKIRTEPETGIFKDIIVRSKRDWNLDGAYAEHWADVAPERTRDTKPGNVSAGLKALMRESVRTQVEKNGFGAVNPEVVRELIEDAMANAMDVVAEYATSESFENWKVERIATIEKAEREGRIS